MMSHEQEVQRLREEAIWLQRRLDELNRRLDAVVAIPPPSPPPVIGEPPLILKEPPAIQPPPVIEPPTIPAPPSESMEVWFGTFWLPRIGMALLLMGMVFLVTWSYRYLGAPGKVALSYACCAALGGLGWCLEKRAEPLARVLQAGALALLYFVTYATHYVETFRVVESQTLALVLLSVVVAGIVWVANRRQSATLAGLALFFGYATTVISGVATFTLTANALLAVAALIFLARHRWVPVALGAVLATYLVYALWVWKASAWQELGRLVFERGYLDDAAFRLRAAFLLLYWTLFTGGGLMARRDALLPVERTGLMTLNNALFFVLFSLLLHHAHPGQQWQFQCLFGGILLMTSVLAYQRTRPERQMMNALFLQGLAVATLGMINRLEGVSLVAVLALESVFLLWLASALQSPCVGWLARAVFGIAAGYAWSKLPGWNNPMICGAACSAAIGYGCARMVKRLREPSPSMSLSAVYFSLISTILLMAIVQEQFSRSARPWGWMAAALLVATLGALLRTRETIYISNLPLAWAHLHFYARWIAPQGRYWTLNESLALVAITLVFGLALWARHRANDSEESRADAVLWPFAVAAIAVAILATFDYAPKRWLLSLLAAEAALLAASRLRVLAQLALAPATVGAIAFLCTRSFSLGSPVVAWMNTLLGVGLLVITERCWQQNTARRVWMVVCLTAVMVFAADKLMAGGLLTVGWAVCGFVLLALGFLLRVRPYRIAGLAVLALGIFRAFVWDMAKVETIYRILSFVALGLILLALAYLYTKNRDKLAKWL